MKNCAAFLVLLGGGILPSFGADPAFQFKIHGIENAGPGKTPVVTFSVVNATGQTYDIKTDPAWAAPARLGLQIGWDTADYTNRDSGTNALPSGGKGAALPIPINALTVSIDFGTNGNHIYKAAAPLPIPGTAKGTGVVAMEGHPRGTDPVTLLPTAIPVKSAFFNFPITGATTTPRRKIVDIAKCDKCHGQLTLHGSNRTDEPQVCVVCHNPNQTDIPYRLATDGPEESVDFKRMVHGIHASSQGFRSKPLVIIGFNHSVNDFSKVTRFPGELRNCTLCHIDDGSKGTFELPLAKGVLGSTVVTRSVNGAKTADADPDNDVKITPIAAVCSSCHDKGEVQQHMIRTGGASFTASPGQIGTTFVERCQNCHGRGKEEDVRKAHEIRGGSGRRDKD
jgi:OmcA/MtrC family decaheme c-type cytochrome